MHFQAGIAEGENSMLKKSFWLHVVAVLGVLMLLAPVASAAPGAALTDCSQTYSVTAGDWLSKLADKYYGSVTAYCAY